MRPREEGEAVTDVYMVSLRAIHLATAVFWAGGTFLLAWFHGFVLGSGDTERTLGRMVDYANMSRFVGVSGMLAAITGLLMYWQVSGGLDSGWLESTYGSTITVGAVSGIVALVVGIVLVGFTNGRVETLYEDVQNEDGNGMTPEQTETLQSLRVRLRRGERWVAILLVVTVLAMATAQYL